MQKVQQGKCSKVRLIDCGLAACNLRSNTHLGINIFKTKNAS